MTILNYLRKKLKKRSAPQPVEYIEEPRSQGDIADAKSSSETYMRELESEVDLSHQGDLEVYARGLTVTKESIERWISSGLLMPDEMKVAEKILQIMRKGQ